MIYVPDKTNYKCFVVQSENTIRGYEEKPRNNATINYRDYYFNADYIYKDGYTQFSSYATLPICLDDSVVTTDFYYRVDLYKILIIFLIMSIFCFYIPIKVFSKFFKKGGL